MTRSPFGMGVKSQLYLIAALAFLAVAALAGSSIYFATMTGRTAQVLYDGSLVGVVEATDLGLLLEKHRRIIELAPLEFDREQLRKDKRTSEEISGEFTRRIERAGRGLADRVATSLPELVRQGRIVLHMAENFAQDKAVEAVDRYVRTATELNDQIQVYRAERLAIANKQATDLERLGRLLVLCVSTIAVAALLLIGPLCFCVIRSVVSRLNSITVAMVRLARNDTTVAIQGLSDGDEIGQMARAVQVFKANAITLLDQKSRFEQLNLWLDIALNNMARGLSMFDANERLVVCNANYARMYDLPNDLTRPGAQFSDIIACRLPRISQSDRDNSPGERQYVQKLAARVAAHPVESRFSQHLVDGRIIDVSVKPIESGGWVALHEDVTEQRRVADSIFRLARQDALTGLVNRLGFREHLDRAVATIEQDEPFALLCIDLDRFKEVNDTLGHPVGDALLKVVAMRLQETARRNDIVARLGGDEFAIIQIGARTDGDVVALADRVIDAVRAPCQILGHRIDVGATVGIAMAPRDAATADDLLRNSDMALYRAKSEGRGRFCIFDPAMETGLRARRTLQADLVQAIVQGQFELYYQPIIGLDRRAVSGTEALIRWRHPTRGMVSPADFIPLAEDTGAIVAIGAWALKTACHAAASWPGGIKVAVNLSVAQFGGPDLVEIVRDALEGSGLPPHRLELEVTESLLLDDNASAIEILHGLRGLGVRIALDDFGTGYSSLSYLRSFPFDKIKIDQSFVRDLSQRRDCVAIVGAVAQLAKSLEMATVAEGVETEDHLEKVRAAGCTEVQGYLFSKPVPASEIVRVIAACDARLKKPVEQVSGGRLAVV